MNTRRVWASRIVLESFHHAESIFATLTYKNEPPELKPDDLTNFIKRTRYYLDRPVRYFACGEYGDRTMRPHYHLALFGVSQTEQSLLEKAWSIEGDPIGFVHVGELNEASANYVAGYVLKKMTKKEDSRLGGKHPEFTRMSRNPGIGAPCVPQLARALAQDGDVTLMRQRGDVPHEIRASGQKRPIGRYLRGKLREAMGWEPTMPPEEKRRLAAERASRSDEEKQALEVKRLDQYSRAVNRAKVVRSKKVL